MRSEAAPAQVVDQPEKPSVRDVFRREAPFVMRMVRRLGAAEADVEDLTQEVFLVLHRRLDDFDPARSIRSWLYGIVRRVVADHRRLARVRREAPSGDVVHLTVPADQPAAIERRDARRILDAALDAMPDEQREIFVLYELEGLSMREIVELTGCPLQTGYSRLHAAREALVRVVDRRKP